MIAPRSLILITIDCLRADHVGFLGYGRPTTPFLDSLAAESFVFSNAIAAGAPTYYSFPAIMASRLPLALGREVIGVAPGETTLASTLKEAGYATAAFLAGNPYLSPRFGHDTGFDTFRDFLDSALPEPSASTDVATRRRWNGRIANACHKVKSVGALYDELYFQYCQKVASPPALSLDEMRRFPSARVIAIRCSGIWDECVLVFTADHGEEFLEHGGRFHAPSKITEELVRVPLLIRVPGRIATRTHKAINKSVFSLMHLAPTLLDTVGIAIPSRFVGRSQCPLDQHRECAAVIECVSGCTNPFHASDRLGPRIVGMREQRYKWVMDFGSGCEQLFDLEKDPGEINPLPPDAEKTVRRRLLEEARRHLTSSSRGRDSEQRLRAQLRDLHFECTGSPAAISV